MSIYLSPYHSINLHIYLPISMSIYLSPCLSSYLHVYIYLGYLSLYLRMIQITQFRICISIYLFVYLSLCISISMSIYLYVYLSLCLSISMSTYLYVYLYLAIYLFSMSISISIFQNDPDNSVQELYKFNFK